MKAIDVFKIACKGLRKWWTIVPLIGIAACTVCFSFAGTIGLSVYTQKQHPCELTVMASGKGKITDQTVADLVNISEVQAATAVLSIPITIKAGKYNASLTLFGIDGNYLSEEYTAGGLFPQNTVMPYIVLNKAACKQFANGEDAGKDADEEVPDIDWLNQSYSVRLGDGTKAVESKVCGVLSEGEETEEKQIPSGYIDLNMAKTLQRAYQLPTDYTSVIVRIDNIGCAKSVERQIAALGYDVENPNTALQETWEDQETQMSYLIIVGVIGSFCFSLLIAVAQSGNFIKQHSTLLAMRWIGMPLSTLKKMLFLQTALVGIIGVVFGIALDSIIPSFVPVEQQMESVFAMPVPLLVAAAVGLLNICVFLLPAVYASKQIKEAIL